MANNNSEYESFMKKESELFAAVSEPEEDIIDPNTVIVQEVSNITSGRKQESQDSVNMFDLLKSINGNNIEQTQASLDAQKQEEEEFRKQQEEQERLRKEKLAKKRFEEEMAERDRIAFEEQQAEMERQIAKQQKNSFLSAFVPKPKKQTKPAEQPPAQPPIEETIIPEEPVTPSTETKEVAPDVKQPAKKSFLGFVGDSIKPAKKPAKNKEPEEQVPEEVITPAPEEVITPAVAIATPIPEPEIETKPKKKKSKTIEPEESEGEAEKWRYLATHDEKTGLKNSRAYSDAIREIGDGECLVIYADVNNLKYSNDKFGHEAGDEVIMALALELARIFPEHGYRIGGDEFVCLYYGNDLKAASKNIQKNINAIHEALSNKISENFTALRFAASIGFHQGSPFKEVISEAEKKMYAEKAAYKKAHPEFSIREKQKGGQSPQTATPEPPKDYDDLLSEAQRDLKNSIRESHKVSGSVALDVIIQSVQSRFREILAIFIVDPSFDTLFVLNNAQTFLQVISEMKDEIDYSYLYVLYKGGPQYYGADEYRSEVTHLFEALGEKVLSGRIGDRKELNKIPGINIFKDIYVE